MEAPGVPTTITSKKMTVRNQDSQAIFEETVVLTRGLLVVHSDKMVVLFTPRNRASAQLSEGRTHHPESIRNSTAPKAQNTTSTMSNRSVSRVEATGDAHRVRIQYENGNATCQKAVYFVDGEKIVLTGDPVAWEKGTRVSGKQITIFLAEERSVVEGGSHVRIEGEGSNQP
ncbi:MAG: LptA/OstA family protein [Nitrospira sp.]|nr:LptA/OstA family protein [Nitrospira sp.]